MTVPSPPAQSSPPALMTQSLGPVSFSDPFHVAERPAAAEAEAADDLPEAVSLVSPVEPATAISGPVSLVGIVLPTAAAAPPADAPASGTLWGAAAAPAAAAADNNAAGALPVDDGYRSLTSSSSGASLPRLSPERSSGRRRTSLADLSNRHPEPAPAADTVTKAHQQLTDPYTGQWSCTANC